MNGSGSSDEIARGWTENSREDRVKASGFIPFKCVDGKYNFILVWRAVRIPVLWCFSISSTRGGTITNYIFLPVPQHGCHCIQYAGLFYGNEFLTCTLTSTRIHRYSSQLLTFIGGNCRNLQNFHFYFYQDYDCSSYARATCYQITL